MGILEGLGGSRYRLPTPDRDITTSELFHPYGKTYAQTIGEQD
jgi:hypothetical protein